jgi:hypothetical protein
VLQQVAQRRQKDAAGIAPESIQAYWKRQRTAIDPMLGLFADETERIAAVLEDAMRTRASSQ